MRILAISDWRTTPLQSIRRIVREGSPDVILYAGDDLGRLEPAVGGVSPEPNSRLGDRCSVPAFQAPLTIGCAVSSRGPL